jgi:hypothetical protein
MSKRLRRVLGGAGWHGGRQLPAPRLATANTQGETAFQEVLAGISGDNPGKLDRIFRQVTTVGAGGSGHRRQPSLVDLLVHVFCKLQQALHGSKGSWTETSGTRKEQRMG